MQIKHLLILAISILLFSTGCNADITGTVVDAETGQPIEGAIILLQWTTVKGLPGLAHHEVDKVVEVTTDQSGKFIISGADKPFYAPQEIIIYKKRYVAWRNDYIFPGWKKRTDFKYRDGIVIKLEPFKEGYSREEHHLFMDHGIMGGGFNSTPKFSEAERQESLKAQEEIDKHK